MLQRPLLWSAAFFMAGILLAPDDRAVRPAAGLCAVCLIGSTFLFPLATNAFTRRLAWTLILGGFVFAGQVAATGSAAIPPEGLELLLRRHPDLLAEGVDFEGTVREARRDPDGQIRLLLDLSWVEMRGRRAPVTGRVALRAREGPSGGFPTARSPGYAWDLPSRGDRLGGYARLLRPAAFGNPGAFDYPRYLRSHGIMATGSVKSLRLLTVSPPRVMSSWLAIRRWLDSTRRRLLEGVDASFDGSPEGRRAAAVTAAILLGDRSGIGQEEIRLLQEAGLSHLLAVSGFHVAVLAGLVLAVLRSAGAGPRLAALATIPVLCLYLGLNQPRDSVTRAVVMAVALLSGQLIHRRPDPLNSVGAACLLILAARPLQIHDAGFQLTFAATVSLIGIAPVLSSRLPGRSKRLGGRAGRWGLALVTVTLSALAGTAPLVAFHFNRVTPGAVLTNPAGGALVALAIVLGIPLALCAQAMPGAASALAAAITWVVTALHTVASSIVVLPGMTFRRVTPSPALCGFYYAALLALVVTSGRVGTRAWRRVLAAAFLLPLALLLLPLDTRRPPRGMRITMLDVGQGESILLESAGGERVLIDAGALLRGGFDLGERVVSTTLWNLGIASLDLLVVTHGDNDHAGGAAAVVRNFRPREIWLPPGGSARGPALERVQDRAQRAGTIVTRVSAGDSIHLGGLHLEVISPLRTGRDRSHENPNESSLVLLASREGRKVLLTADAGTAAERRLIRLSRLDVLKVGHHGSRTATSRQLLARTRPRLALISCGRLNRFGHPHREVLVRLERSGARICRTDRHGAVEIELLGSITRLGAPCPGEGSRSLERDGLRYEADDQDRE